MIAIRHVKSKRYVIVPIPLAARLLKTAHNRQ